jgi:muramoyltetrapeptide carboxypeptidase
MTLVKPPYLKAGDKIAIIATARKIGKEYIDHAVAEFKAWGLEVVLGENLLKEAHQFAGTDEQRSADLQTMLDDASVKAIIVARGGYGTARIIDSIDFSEFKKQPKWVIGFSDITVLHSHIHNLGVASLHATMPINFAKNKESVNSLKNALFGVSQTIQADSSQYNRTGTAEAELVGGNLSILYSMLGSASDIDTRGKILFIEDLDEYLYHIDRIMIALKRAGKLANLAGLVVGHMNDMKDNAIPFGKTAEEIILDAIKEYNFPVCFNFTSGHLEPNLALRFGEKVRLSVDANAAELKGV